MNRDKLIGVFERAVVVHERHVPMICELHLDLFCCESAVTALVCPREEDAVGVFVTSGDLHAKDDAGEIVSFGASGCNSTCKGSVMRSNENKISHGRVLW